MKPEATRLIEAQRCEIITKLNKPNTPSKRALGGSMKSVKAPAAKFGTIERTYCNEIQLIETFVESDSATSFKGFEALHNNVLDIDNQLLCSNVQTEVEQMYDELRWSFETFQWNINKLTLNFNWKNSCVRGKWICMTCSNNKVWTLIFVKTFAHLTGMRISTGAYLSGRLLVALILWL